jgi:hypothetical protein
MIGGLGELPGRHLPNELPRLRQRIFEKAQGKKGTC